MRAYEICRKAADLVSGDRNVSHGDMVVTHRNIASLWNAYLCTRPEPAKPLNARDVALMMALLKLARMQSGAFNLDDHIDAVGYISIAGDISSEGHDR